MLYLQDRTSLSKDSQNFSSSVCLFHSVNSVLSASPLSVFVMDTFLSRNLHTTDRGQLFNSFRTDSRDFARFDLVFLSYYNFLFLIFTVEISVKSTMENPCGKVILIFLLWLLLLRILLQTSALLQVLCWHHKVSSQIYC